jgi:hypothetical protein
MKTGVTENKDELIAQLLYQGVPRDEIEKRASTSAGHISKVLQREEELVGEGNVKALRRLAKALSKDRQLSIVDIQRGVIFLNSCNAMDLDDGEVRDAMPRIVECCKKSGIAPKDLPLDIETKAARLEVLKSEIDAGEKGALEAKKRHEEAFREARVTNEALSRFNIYMNMLAKRATWNALPFQTAAFCPSKVTPNLLISGNCISSTSRSLFCTSNWFVNMVWLSLSLITEKS